MLILAYCRADVQAANRVMPHTTLQSDAIRPCGGEANAAMYLTGQEWFEIRQTTGLMFSGHAYVR
jgi:hypothetical protein